MRRHHLPYLAVSRVTGADAPAFLQAQLSADLAGLQKDEASHACYCSPRGQVYGLLLACRRGEDLLLIGNADLLPSLLGRLRMFVLRARVELTEDASLAVLGDDTLPEPGSAAPGNRWLAPAGLAYTVLPRDAVPAATLSASAWKARELEAGIAWLDERTSERFIPQMLGYENIGAVSFRKGCYPGQEIIARARYLGKIKRGPLRLVLETGANAASGLDTALETGSVVALETDADRQDATLIDYAPLADGRFLLFVVAPLMSVPPHAVEIEGRSYRCATM